MLKDQLSCRKMSAVLGTARSCLMALPFLRAFTETLVGFVNQHTLVGWDHRFTIPDSLKSQLKEIKVLLDSWEGRPFASPPPNKSCTQTAQNWPGGVDIKSKKFVQNFWREQSAHHINWKEMVAAISTVQSLATPHTHVKLSVDNTTVYYYMHKAGGRLPHYNALLRPFFSD